MNFSILNCSKYKNIATSLHPKILLQILAFLERYSVKSMIYATGSIINLQASIFEEIDSGNFEK